MRTVEFLVAKDPVRDHTGDMAMLRLVMSLARESMAVRFIGMGGEDASHSEGRIIQKPKVRISALAARVLRSQRSLVHERFDSIEVRRAIAASTADLFAADHAYMAEPYLATGRTEPLYTSTVVSESLVWSATYGRLGRLQAPRILRDELRVANASRAVGTYDDDEAGFYRERGIERTHWLDLTLPQQEGLPSRDLSVPRLAFVGDRQWRPNGEGFRVLLELWPRISRGIVGAELVIIGRAEEGPQPPLPDGVRDLGFVPDLDGMLATCRGILAPIRTGGGVRVKILEAASRGIPVVGTPAAVGSLDRSLGIVAASTDEEFIDAARRLLLDPDVAQAAGDELAARNRAHWAAGTPHRSVEAWLA